jgi:hypothetical protein
MFPLTHSQTRRPVGAHDAQNLPAMRIPVALARPAAWARFAEVALTLLAFLVVVTALVVLKSLVWIPHF